MNCNTTHYRANSSSVPGDPTYAAAVQAGRPPSYVVDDAAVAVPLGDGTEWTPRNFDGKFMGPTPMRRGLYLSRNLIAVRVGMEVGPQAVVDEARRFGLTTPIPPYPSIFLGSADVIPIELVAGYSAFATLGQRSAPYAVTRVENQRGDVLWEPEVARIPVLSAEEAYLMVNMMKDVNQRGTAYGAVAGAGFRVPSAGKTGTTNDGTDVWYVGYTPDLVAGVWMGFDRPQKIKPNAQGGELAAPAWTAFMTEVYRRKPTPPDWPRPAGVVAREVVANTNLLYSPECYGLAVTTELFIAGTEPIETCVPGQYYDSLGVPVPVPADSAGLPAYPPLPGAVPRPTVPPDTADSALAPNVPRRPLPRPMPGYPGDTMGLPRRDSAGVPILRPPPRPRLPRADTARPPVLPPDTVRRPVPDTTASRPAHRPSPR